MLAAHDAQLAGYPATAEEDELAAADEQLPWWEFPDFMFELLAGTTAC